MTSWSTQERSTRVPSTCVAPSHARQTPTPIPKPDPVIGEAIPSAANVRTTIARASVR